MTKTDTNPLAAQTETGITRAETLAQMGRMVDAGVLNPATRSFLLLDYLLAHWHREGPEAVVKAYAIAIDILGRGADFDPATDSIVRVELGRLRKLLEMYHAGPGRADPLWISVPKGRTGVQVLRAPPPPQARTPARRLKWSWLALLGAVLVLGLAGLVWRMSLPDYPHIAILPMDSSLAAADDWISAGITAQLASELSHYRSLRVTSRSAEADYALTGRLEPQGPGEVLLTSHLTRQSDGVIVWSARDRIEMDGSDVVQTFFAQVRAIVLQVGGPSGVVNAEARARLRDMDKVWRRQPATAFLCELRFQSFDITKDPSDGAQARACLRDLTAAGSTVGSLWAAQGFMQFLDWTASGQSDDAPQLQAALAAAYRGIDLDPTGADGHEALGSILSALGRGEEARAALGRAIELNPSNPELPIKLGWQDCLNGDWDQGVAAIRSAMEMVDIVPGWYRIPLAMNALRLGDQDGLAFEARAMIAAGDPRGRVLLAAASRMNGGATDGVTEAEIAAIERVFPEAETITLLRKTLE